MPEIVTSEIGEKWIQPEIPLVKVMAQEALNKAIAPIPQSQNFPSNTIFQNLCQRSAKLKPYTERIEPVRHNEKWYENGYLVRPACDQGKRI
ncbi:MAG: hypothetical protein ACKO1W_10115 [Microcystaceae cyanobacterium]